jgi:ribosomal protein L10
VFTICLIAPQYLVFSPDVRAKKLLDLDKKMPDFVLIGAVVENRLVSKKSLQDISKMPLLESQRAELCAILNLGAQKTISMLSSNQQTLARNLEQHVKDHRSTE